MSRKFLSTVAAMAFLLLVQAACNLQSGPATPDTFATLNGIYTASALTIEAAGTQSGFTATPGLPEPTVTPVGSPTATNQAVLPSPVPQSRCDAAQFLGDVTYPDGSVLPRNTTFVKIWRIKNVGTCTWTTSYALVFTGGDSMSSSAVVAMPGSVKPGQYIEVPITLKAPDKDGKYRGYWKLRNSSGVLFGLGAQADTAFWVDIRVTGPSHIIYNFADNYCQAEWTNGTTTLACPGTEGDLQGSVVKLNAPRMENGSKENEPGLLTIPQDRRNGIISGEYPALVVQAGDRFRTIVNCQYDSPKCDVVFRLDYRSGGQVKTLASWHEVYEGKYYPVDLDLSGLAGQTVKFILFVSANGGNNQDNALWLNPHIVRQGNPLPTWTPSLTPTITLTSTPTLTPTITTTPTPTESPTPTATETPTETPTP